MAETALRPLKFRGGGGRMELPPIVVMSSDEDPKRVLDLSLEKATEKDSNGSFSKSAPLAEIEPVLEQLVTHTPDLVVFRSPNAPLPQTVHSYGVVLFADISGFTSLCEKYCSGAKSKSDGIDQLTTTLNSYLSQIVQAILEAGGDILKFAGDAFLAFWSCSRFAATGLLAYVLQESLMMQNDFDNFQSSDGDILRMKLGLSVGRVEIHYVGNAEYKTFDVTGEAIDDVNKAQSLTKSGAVVISKAAWDMCNKQRCIAKLIGPGYAQVSKMIPEEDITSTVNTMTQLMGNEQRKQTLTNIMQTATNARMQSGTKRFSEPVLSSNHSNPWEEGKRASVAENSGRKASSNRSSVPGHLVQLGRGLNFRQGLKDFLTKITPEAKEELRAFILPTVTHKIDHGHEVSWLSELREVSVLFINLDPGQQMDAAGTLKLLQSSFDIIYPSLTKYEGCLNKVFMFDKGCTFLCIFGLPHAKHEDDCCRALRAARNIFNNLKDLDLLQYSIGVTTGVAFCGVVGHPQRHEYTVIGQKVNMAARLMMKFPNAISCDETTKMKSGLSGDKFTLAPPVTLKGITNPENIHTFSTEIVETLHTCKSDIHLESDLEDLIGRDKEIGIFLEELMHISEHTHRDPGVIIVSGGVGVGKTKLLRAMKAKAADLGFRVVSGIGGLIEQHTPFFTVKTLITRLLELDSCKNIHEREQLVLQHVTDDTIKHLLPLLNDVLVLKFPHTQATMHMNHAERTKGLHKLLFNIVHNEALTKPCVFGIDDAHWIDADSWEFLLDLALDPNAIFVLTTRPLDRLKEKHPAMIEILNHTHTKMVNLEGLSPDEMIKLACQMLKVDSLPDVLQQIIRKRSHGVPLWCEELVETMLELDYLQVIEQDEVIAEEEDEESFGEELSGDGDRLLHQSAIVPQVSHRKVVMKAKPRRKSTAQLSSGIGIGDIPIPDSVAGMVLTRIDHMSPSEQMTLKCAAVAGISFSRTMLESIIPNSNPQTFNQSLNALAEHGIVECSVAAQVRNMNTDVHTRSGHHLPLDDPHLHCPCLQKDPLHLAPKPMGHKHHNATHPPVDHCQLLQFVHAYIQETAYGLWTESQRRSLHENAAIFLESEAHKCVNCGGGGFIQGGAQPTSKKRKKSSTPGGRAFVGTANIKNKLRRKSTVPGTSRRGSRISAQGSVDVSGSLLNLQRRIQSRVEQNNIDDGVPEVRITGIRYGSICDSETLDVDMQDCHCDEVLAQVYPQLVRHWRTAGDMHKTMEYLLEASSAAVATFNNMEALSLLHEAKHILEEYGKDMITDMEHARLESLIAQALFQCGQVDECMPHFHTALSLLHTKLPTNSVSASMALVYHSFKQVLHIKFPRRFIASKSGLDSQTFLDQARCMAHVTHAYHLQHKNLMTLVAALKQLNAAEEAQEDIHELIEAYATMIECCQLFDLKRLANYYLEAAISHCSDVRFGVEDMHTYAHLLSVALNSKFCQGKIAEAAEIGMVNYRITSRMHDVSMEMSTLPLLFFTQSAGNQVELCKETLKQLSEIAHEADDLREQAMYDCCRFDALLDFGVGAEGEHSLVEAAKSCCEEDIYHFDDIERFFLVSSLSLWYARQRRYDEAAKYGTIASGLQPKLYETYLAVRALLRFVEYTLLMWQSQHTKKMARQGMGKLKKVSHKYAVIRPRLLHLTAYWKFTQKKTSKARKLINLAIDLGRSYGCVFDADWAEKSKQAWFGCTSTSDSTTGNGTFVLQ